MSIRPEPGIDGPPVWMVLWMPYLRAQATISLRLVAGLDRAQAHFAQQAHAGFGEFLEVALDHALLDDGRAGQHLHAAGAEVVEGALRGDGQRLQAHDVLGAAGQVHLAGGNHGGHAAVHGGVDPADLALARRPVAEHRVHVAVDQARRHAGLLRVDDGLRVFEIAVLLLADRDDQAVVHHDGVGVEDGLVDVAREQQPDVL